MNDQESVAGRPGALLRRRIVGFAQKGGSGIGVISRRPEAVVMFTLPPSATFQPIYIIRGNRTLDHCAKTWRLGFPVPATSRSGRLSRTLSAARTPPCGRLMMVSDRVFTCDVIVDDRPCVLCVVAASGRAL